MIIRYFILVIVDVLLFASLRILSVLVAFLFGIGASASSEKYTPYILVPSLALQILLIWIVYKKGKYIKEIKEVIVLIGILLILYVLGENNLIPF